jgi:hypothetical protein
MSRGHFTLSFPLKSSDDAKAVAEELPLLMPELFQVMDAIGTIHYSRFTLLRDKSKTHHLRRVENIFQV